jgi:hypothetical protein
MAAGCDMASLTPELYTTQTSAPAKILRRSYKPHLIVNKVYESAHRRLGFMHCSRRQRLHGTIGRCPQSRLFTEVE